MLVFFALGNAKVLSFMLGDAKVPNANGFALQWNIGLKVNFKLNLMLLHWTVNFKTLKNVHVPTL